MLRTAAPRAARSNEADMNILILLTLPPDVRRDYHDAIREAFPEHRVDLVDDVSHIDDHLPDADVLITFAPHLRARADEVFRAAGKLKWVQALGTGVDNIADRPTLRPDVILTRMHAIHGPAMAEAALMAMLALSRDLPRLIRNQQDRRWERWPARLLEGKTVGILGIGAIAEVLAPRCRMMGMRTVGISSAPRDVAGFDRMVGRDDLAAAVPELDYFILLTPYSKDTHHLVDARVLAAMKPDAYLINLARGGVVDEDALLQALRQQTIAGAALDVFSQEPLPQDHPFWSLPNVLITPHVGGFNDGYARQAIPVVLENIRRFLAGDTDNMLNVVPR
jgi:D-2-hydroxyacid dehydrogenase (NADP+)